MDYRWWHSPTLHKDEASTQMCASGELGVMQRHYNAIGLSDQLKLKCGTWGCVRVTLLYP
jgi:hypothetical protein